jgi:hypothetical protein
LEIETTMRPRPIRSQIYLPALRFGITDEDWGFVIIASVLGYAIPLFFGLKVSGVPLELIGWLLTMSLSVITLNITRRKSRPSWLWHLIQAKLQGNVSRRRLLGESPSPWLKKNRENQ